jgi:hypothetical protein
VTGTWYACSEPERATDPWVVWHRGECRGCAVKAEAVLHQIIADPDEHGWLQTNAPQALRILDQVMQGHR